MQDARNEVDVVDGGLDAALSVEVRQATLNRADANARLNAALSADPPLSQGEIDAAIDAADAASTAADNAGVDAELSAIAEDAAEL